MRRLQNEAARAKLGVAKLMLGNAFAFTFTADQYRRGRKLAAAVAASFPAWAYVVLVILSASQVLVASVHREWLPTALYGVITGFWSVTAWRSKPARRIPWAGVLTLAEDGLSGRLDRQPATIAWSDIDSIFDVDETLIVVRRRNLSPVVIPKASIADVGALWAFLEDRLISKRGLIRSNAPRTTIVNSAC